MPPRVTVIMATYNWSSVLPYSIGSALLQTFADFELLVVGDGCTDDSEAVVNARDDRRVRWINLPVNSGHQSTPNNEGLRQARGERLVCDCVLDLFVLPASKREGRGG
ncbi:MAG TPA: glycosyltransferase family A protein [Thermoanaerobaculia bacterium]|nr:glycosyltransferase family A protein [Thermoanaerobaculia bacterium]